MNRLKNLLQDKLVRNFLNIFSGDAIGSVLSIVSISFVTKGIGMEKYGFIVLIQGITSLVDGIFNFQSWQGFIKFFPAAKDDDSEVKKLIKFSYILDIVTALIAFIILNSAGMLIKKIYNFTPQEMFLLVIFSIYIIFNIQGTPIGILRSFDRFDMLRNQRVITSIYNFIMLGVGFYLKLDLGYFVFVYLSSNILNGLLINIFAIIVLKKRKLLGFIFQKSSFNKEFFKFTCLTNINSSLDIPVQYFDNLLIGKMLSLEQLGIYKICKTVAIVLDKVGTPIYQTLYPYFCETIAKKDIKEVFRKFLKVSVLLLGVCTVMIVGLNIVGFYLFSKFFSELVLNYKFEINLYIIMKSLGTVFIAVHPLFLSLGYIKVETRIIFIANLIYMGVLFPMIKNYGLSGVIAAYGIQVILIVGMKMWYILSRREKISFENQDQDNKSDYYN
ncbi:lipopolysaccharide biosynthesis protein [Fusobacterium sp.]|uniref:lipopolysaccharide biosynthesis protein n=1 Tax=Fusobacterium sp. TaxID=68766 RepID=UPI002903D4A4|nr:lipopolysaccharide biosynthesis protein [Fusobacterium sp.]MDU1911495.1 lipopolysaccharide biosynthesis protein [Fusobacterium sp.]